jgi:hypothetical protein
MLNYDKSVSSVKDNSQRQHKQINTKISQLADQHASGYG